MKIREAESQESGDHRMTALVQFRKRINTPQLNALILEKCGWDERADALIAKLQAEDRARIEAEFEAAKAAVREQLQLIEDTKAKIAGVEQEVYRLESLLAKHESAVARAKERLSELGHYASKKESQATEEAIERAQGKCDEVVAQLGTVKSQLQHLLLVVWPSLGVELQRRTSEERRLRSAVEGEESYTHASGLVLPAGARF